MAGHSAFHENMRNHPNGLVKEMIKTFGPDFRSLLDIEGVHSVKYLVNMRRLEVIASQPGYSQVQMRWSECSYCDSKLLSRSRVK